MTVVGVATLLFELPLLAETPAAARAAATAPEQLTVAFLQSVRQWAQAEAGGQLGEDRDQEDAAGGCNDAQACPLLRSLRGAPSPPPQANS